jgi:hypothetical protein
MVPYAGRRIPGSASSCGSRAATVTKLAGELEGAGLVRLGRPQQHGTSLGYTLLARRERMAARNTALSEKMCWLSARDLDPTNTLH